MSHDKPTDPYLINELNIILKLNIKYYSNSVPKYLQQNTVYSNQTSTNNMSLNYLFVKISTIVYTKTIFNR